AWIRDEAELKAGKAGDAKVKETPVSTSGGSEAKAEDKKTETKKPDAGEPRGINVIYVADIDVLSSEFVRMRNEPNAMVARFRFDNVPFVCNVIDAVGGDSRFLEIRKRKPRHSTLRMVEVRATEARKLEQDQINKSKDEYNKAVKDADADAQKVYAELQKVVDALRGKQARGEEVDPGEITAKMTQLSVKKAYIERQLAVSKQRLKRKQDQELAGIERKRDQEIQTIQNDYKLRATLFPPIIPALVGLVVW